MYERFSRTPSGCLRIDTLHCAPARFPVEFYFDDRYLPEPGPARATSRLQERGKPFSESSDCHPFPESSMHMPFLPPWDATLPSPPFSSASILGNFLLEKRSNRRFNAMRNHTSPSRPTFFPPRPSVHNSTSIAEAFRFGSECSKLTI